MKTIIFISLFFVTLSVAAQRPLQYEDISKEGELYPMGKNENARVTISTAMNLKPYFKNKDLQVFPAKIDTLGNEVFYHLDMNVQQFSSLWVNVNGFSPLYLSLKNIQPNLWFRFKIFDPEPTIVDCFHQLDREGSKSFHAGNYEEAKRKYEELSKTCSELKDEEKRYVDNQLKTIDTLIVWKNMANEYFAAPDYLKAMEYYDKIHSRNPADEQSHSKSIEAQMKFSENCKLDFNKAEKFYNDRDLANAKIYYQKIVDKQCSNMADAQVKLDLIENELKNKCRHVLTYETAKDVPVGFSTGNYNDHKVGGYFTLRLNSDVFEAIRTNTDSLRRPEINVSFGWTIPIVKPIWIFFGPGYTGVGQYVVSNKEKQNDTPEKFDLKINSAISPEVGILGKIVLGRVGIALRYTYQYRFALDKETINYIGTTRHVFGIGICF
ncbi:MAG: hypothetical protein FWD60_03555 [Candidatus Azobacteroides sp.]|nr:hypothetical protein [Candidatus Azobacteroides sp.]